MSVDACCTNLGNKSLECVERCPKIAMITLLVVGILAVTLATVILVGGYLPKSVALVSLSGGLLMIPLAGGTLYIKHLGEALNRSLKLEKSDYDLLQQTMDTRNIDFNELLTDAFAAHHTTILEGSIGNLEFTHERYPGIRFKVGLDEDREKRFQQIYDNMAFGYKVCCEKKLYLLSVPSAALFHGTVNDKTYPILMIGGGEVHPDPEVHKMLYLTIPERLKEAILQLNTFVGITKWSEIDWTTIPVLSSSLEQENLRILLLIGEGMGEGGGIHGITITKEFIGIPGHEERQREKKEFRGLLGCLPVSHHSLILTRPPTMQNPPTLDPVLSFLAEKQIWMGTEQIKLPYPIIQFEGDQLSFYIELRSYLDDLIRLRYRQDSPLREKRRFEIPYNSFDCSYEVKAAVLSQMQERGMIGLLREVNGSQSQEAADSFQFYA